MDIHSQFFYKIALFWVQICCCKLWGFHQKHSLGERTKPGFGLGQRE